MSPLERHNVTVKGHGKRAMVFAHGFGCDKAMWRFVAPQFEAGFRTVLFDHIGVGGAALSAYDPVRHSSLEGYADDVLDIARALDLRDAVFVGHSVSAMIGVLASLKAPGVFGPLVLVGPSPRYVDEPGYHGGFSRGQVDELLTFLDENPLGWAEAMAPVIMGNADRPELGQELAESFCRADPAVARAFARVTFLSDNRGDLARVSVPTLVLQCRDDVIAPMEVGAYVHDAIPGSRMVLLDATGHCPNLSAPQEVVAAIQGFV